MLLPLFATVEDVPPKLLTPALVIGGDAPAKMLLPVLVVADDVPPKVLLKVVEKAVNVPPKMPFPVPIVANDVAVEVLLPVPENADELPKSKLVELPELVSFFLPSVNSTPEVADIGDIEVDGIGDDPIMKIGSAAVGVVAGEVAPLLVVEKDTVELLHKFWLKPVLENKGGA